MRERIPFVFDFAVAPSEKAANDTMVEVLDDGDLLIEGIGLNFDIDRQEEAFEDSGLLQKSLDHFVASGGPLCFHHKKDKVLGQVTSATVIPGKGVELKARVDGEIRNSPELGPIYGQIKKGTIKHLSAGGIFKRRMTPQGPRIYDADFVEWSATAAPVGRGTSFAVVAGKALEDDVDETSTLDVEDQTEELKAIAEAGEVITRMNAILESLDRSEKALPETYDTESASGLTIFLENLKTFRSSATSIRVFGENYEGETNAKLTSLADDVESSLVKFERKAHKLASELAPLPPAPSGAVL